MPLSMTAMRTPSPRAPSALRGRRTDVRYGFGEVELVIGDADDARDRGVPGKRRQIGCVDVEHDGVQRQLQRGNHVRGAERSETMREMNAACSEAIWSYVT